MGDSYLDLLMAQQEDASTEEVAAEGGGGSTPLGETPTSNDDGGCGCRLPSSGQHGDARGLLVVFGLLMTARRRRPC